MKRVILDTNIYGRIIDNKESDEIRELAEKRRDIIIYGFDVVRKELRDVAANVRIDGKLVRMMLLGLYDKLVKFHAYSPTPEVTQLANDYFIVYSQLRGKRSKEEMLNDFLIVGCASMYELDIVVTDVRKTMLSQQAINSYKIVNKLREHRIPEFIGYEA